ncbi:MAG: NRDE family protein [Verrucomicrobia bacterium]|nr:NRDE family protein [Verrucomicrobiota bacterium]MCH8527718.1 NRDE family protein [Kiritimatiellia bacterium]
MCTASWRLATGNAELWFNRDEQRCRPAALPPHTDDKGATYPIDPQGGGTWIFVNRHGLIAALLNGYTSPPPGPLRSRGLLLKELSDCADLNAFSFHLTQAVALDRYNAFQVIALQHTARVWQWDGRELREQDVPLPMLTSSSFEPESVGNARRTHYVDTVRDPLRPTGAELDAFHAWHDPVKPHVSVRMSRSVARTVSFVRVRVQSGGLPVMNYTAL